MNEETPQASFYQRIEYIRVQYYLSELMASLHKGRFEDRELKSIEELFELVQQVLKIHRDSVDENKETN